MQTHHRDRSAHFAALLAVAILTVACDEPTAPPKTPVPTTGSIQITATTTGSGRAPDLYKVEMRLQTPLASMIISVPANGTRTSDALQPGFYLLTILELAPNCEPDIAGSRTVTVVAGHPTLVALNVTCAASTQLAFVNGVGSDAEIYLVNTDGTGAMRITTQPGADVNPAWSPDGSRIAFASERDGNFEIYVMQADGTNPVRLTSVPAADYRPAWSPDGGRIAFVSERDGNAEIYVINADGTSPTRLTSNDAKDGDPAWSPDGSRIAFATNRDGRGEVYVMAADGSDLRAVTSSFEPDAQPVWSPDGSMIAVSTGYSSESSRINVLNASGSGFSTWVTSFVALNGWDPAWSPDGRKIMFTVVSCGWYYYDDCSSVIRFIRSDGNPQTLPIGYSPSEPTWRP